MSRRARLYEIARDLKRADCYVGDDDEQDDLEAEPIYSCAGCGKARSEPFHCTPCNRQAEAPGWED